MKKNQINTIIEKDKFFHEDGINVLGARVHNLKNVDVSIPRNKLTVITGLSGSGKSSLAFDTIHAEGQRRYIETFSAYARQFLGIMERPDVDKISGLSPVISIEQKTTIKNPRSTVGTITEIYDFLRLLYSRIGVAHSYISGEKMIKYTDEQVISLIIEKYSDKKIILLSPIVQGRKGNYRELLEEIRKKGFLQVRIDEKIRELSSNLSLNRYKNHNIEIVVDKIKVNENSINRLKNSLEIAMKHGKGVILILDNETQQFSYFSRHLMCPSSGISYNEPAPHSFSFNSPQGACKRCNGLGMINEIDVQKIIPNPKLSIAEGGITAIGKANNSLIFWQIAAIGEKYKFNLKTPIEDIPEDVLNIIINGSEETFKIKNTPLGQISNLFLNFDGIIRYISGKQERDEEKRNYRRNSKTKHFVKKAICPECKGARLKQESLHFKIADKNIDEISNYDISDLKIWFDTIESKLSAKQNIIAREIIKEVKTRLQFLLDVGLNYLSLSRSSKSLSGGENQRIRLATQIGSQLVNVLYILDEPSIGLHQRDNIKLINSLKQLRDAGNSIIVVEHDKEMILSSDFVIDLGPFAGKHGGEIVAHGDIASLLKSNTLTSDYLNNRKQIKVPETYRKGNGKTIVLKGATGNNLKNVNCTFPLGKFICVTGVSGSGKSSLINETLHPILSKHFYRSHKEPLEYKSIKGIENIDKVIEVDQSPLGRTPRSNPVTYTGVFSDIRSLFESIPESKIRAYKAGRFSFNVKGGRCETCRGAGLKTIEMNFLPDVYVLCEDCNGRRYNLETLEIRFKGKSISDVLNMTINQAVEFFENIPSIRNKLITIQEVGLGYITLGQSSTTLSGGESQRVKLAAELAKRDTGKTLYILDEPTTGLHFEDIRVLLEVLNKLVDKGNTIIIIEHNIDVIKVADYIIDMGKEGGKNGGEIIFAGSPTQLITKRNSYTAKFLKKELNY